MEAILRDQIFGFRLHLREPDLRFELELTNKQAPSTSFQATVQQICTYWLQACPPGTSLPNNHQSGGKQKLSLWFSSQHQPIMLKGNKIP